MKSLILLACSGAKLNYPAPAFELYRGVMYETFRAHVKPQARPSVVILSALHGFVDPNMILAPYEQKMTIERSQEMLSNLPKFMDKVVWPANIGHVFLAGGKTYRQVMRAAIDRMNSTVAVTETSGGIGCQRSQLGRFLDSLGSELEIVGYHANGTPLFRSAGGFTVGDLVVTAYRNAPWAPQYMGVIRELFAGPSGPTACLDLGKSKRGTTLCRWIGLEHIAPVSGLPGARSLAPSWKEESRMPEVESVAANWTSRIQRPLCRPGLIESMAMRTA